MTTPKTSIIINCARTHSNLLQVIPGHDGVYLFYLNQTTPKSEPELIGEGDFMDFCEYPELRDIVSHSFMVDVWDTDLLWSIATANEDHAITADGLAALPNDDLWELPKEPDFTNLPAEASTV